MVTMVNADESPFRVPTVSPNRQGWRARLANVERLLTEAVEKAPDDLNRRYLIEPALTEVRAMIDGDDE
jgi:hypothetical protein